ISADLKTWTIKRHPSLKWSDGSPLTATDLEFSLQLYANPDFANTFGFPLTSADDPVAVERITQVDNLTVTLQLRHGTPTILALLADGATSILSSEESAHGRRGLRGLPGRVRKAAGNPGCRACRASASADATPRRLVAATLRSPDRHTHHR